MGIKKTDWFGDIILWSFAGCFFGMIVYSITGSALIGKITAIPLAVFCLLGGGIFLIRLFSLPGELAEAWRNRR